MATIVCLMASWLAGQQPADATELQPLVKTLQAVAPHGVGHREAAKAWEKLVQADAAQLPAILAGLDQANALAANWIRTAVDAIAERQLQRGAPLPTAELERFLGDTQHAPRARRLAYEWLVRVDPSARERILGTLGSKMLDDPSLEMRRDAVAQAFDGAVELEKEQRKSEAVILLRRGLTAARDPDQIRLLADRLRKLGQTVDLVRQFGFVVRWKLIGPFDNVDNKGFDAVYGPEKELNFSAACSGKRGEVRWIDFASTDPSGSVDLNKALGEEKGVTAYAAAEFYSNSRREVEFRMTSFNALKLWLNGALLFRQPVYHSGSQLDQWVARGVLQPGKNTILLKINQNEQTQEWARVWGFQLRVCDGLGGAVPSADRQASPAEKQRSPEE